MTSKGLFCQAGQFYIDPRAAVDHAVITHAHSDHARKGSRKYYTASSGLGLLKARLGKNISVAGIQYGQKFSLNGVTLSFHPAGHILGSAQVRIEALGEVWVVSGDYKREPDPTCAPFEVVPCDVFVTEATFGTPGFQWDKDADLGREIFMWWETNAKRGTNSVLFAYSLGKTQRVLGLLYPHAKRPILCHPAAAEINKVYRDEGIRLAPTKCLSEVPHDARLNGDLILAPQSFLNSDNSQILGNRFETAFASGWMAQGSHGYDQGFALSDHADWSDLLRTIEETGAKRVYVQHRGKGALVRKLKSMGIFAFADSELLPQNPDQLMLF